MDLRTLTQRALGLLITLQACLAKRAEFMSVKSLKPNPPSDLLLVNLAQLFQ